MFDYYTIKNCTIFIIGIGSERCIATLYTFVPPAEFKDRYLAILKTFIATYIDTFLNLLWL